MRYFNLCLFCLLLFLAIQGLAQNNFANALIVILSFSLFGYFFFQKRMILFEPFSIFTAYYTTTIPAAIYLKYSSFDRSLYITSTSFVHEIENLFALSLLYLIIGYLSAMTGYLVFVKHRTIDIRFDENLPIGLVKVVIFCFALVAILNFGYNIWYFAGGNVALYFSNVSIRALEFSEKGGTTLGYLFGYVAAYCWLYLLLRNQKRSWLFGMFFFVTVSMRVSTGRITQTVAYVMSFLVILYFVKFKQWSKQHFKIVVIAVVICLFATLFYFARITSSLIYNRELDSSWTANIISYLDWETLMHYAVDRGNVPNIPILMKIIDSWEEDIGYLWGSSLFSGLYGFIPSTLRPKHYQPSHKIKNVWYSDVIGGSLPPTGVGEMYANFGFLGPIGGMFVFGALIAIFYNFLAKYGSYWFLVIYSQVVLGFVMIFPKGEFDNLSPQFVAPIALLVVFFRMFKTRKG